MRIRPGRNLILFYAALTLVSCVTFVAPQWISVIIVLALLPVLYLAIMYYRLRQMAGNLVVKRDLPVVVGRDVEFPVLLRIENQNNLKIRCNVRDSIPPNAIPNLMIHSVTIAADSAETITQTIRIPDRGKYNWNQVWLEISDPLNWIAVQTTLGDQQSLKVLPEIFVSEEGLKQSTSASIQLLDKLKVARQQGVGTEFESLSEFRDGDDYRRIDWRTTARVQYPVVRRYQIERHRDVVILIDCGRLMGQPSGAGSKLDCAVDAGLMLARVALNGGDRCGMGLFDSSVIGFVPPQSGTQSMGLLTECVYDAKSELRETNFSNMFGTMQFKQSKRSLVIVLSDIVDFETSGRFRQSLATLAERHVVLFAALKTPLLDEIITTPPATLDDGFQKAVSLKLQRERKKAIGAIRQTGVHILDQDPKELTVPLINHFIELRQGNLL